MNMDNRIRYLDKVLVWMMSFVMLVPTLLGFAGSLTTYVAAATENPIVDAVLYEGPDGSATVQAVHDPEAQKIDWTVILNKAPTLTPTYLQLEIDISESGLQTPFDLSEHTFSETKENVTLIKATLPTLETDTRTLTFSTAIADSTKYDFSIKMLVQVIGDETSLATIQTSPLVKQINFSVPQPLQQVEQESSQTAASTPEEQASSEESLPPAVEETASEIIEEQPSESEEVVESESIPEPESSVTEEEPNEVIHPPVTPPEEVKPQPESQPQEEAEPEEEVFDPNIAEPVSKSYVPVTFPVPVLPVKRLMQVNALPGNVSVNKTAVACEGCRAYEVTLDITGVPPVKPVDIVLILDKSGSMAELTAIGHYTAITTAPATNGTYYVKVNGEYQQLTYYNSQNSSGWRYGGQGNRRYVSWSPSGDDSAEGSNSNTTPTPKPFYRRETRMEALQKAAIKFSSLALAANPDNRVSIVQFDGPSTVTGNGSPNQASITQSFTSNITSVTNAINGLVPLNGTNTEAGLIAGLNAFTTANPQNPNSQKVAILFTDGLPTASNGNLYSETTVTSHAHFQKAITAATPLKNYGSVYSVGLVGSMTTAEYTAAEYLLNQIQNSGTYLVPTSEDLQSIFDEIYTQIDNYGTNAVVTDVIGDDFDLVPGTLPQGATYNEATRTITWTIGNLSGEKSLTYQVKAKDSVLGSDDTTVKLPTNKVATLKYTDVNKAPNQSLTFPVPMVHVAKKLAVETTDAEIILGDTIQLGSGTNATANNYMNISGGTANYTYAWYLGSSTTPFSTARNPSVNPTSETTYRVVITDVFGCSTTGYITVKIKAGQLIIHKKDEAGNLIINNAATFTLTKDGSPVFTQTTGNTGIATFSNLSSGTYLLKETIAPNGFLGIAGTYTVVVSGTNGQVTVTVTDPSGSVVNSNPLVITNKITTISIPVQKLWIDNQNALLTRPENIVVQLFQNDVYMTGKDLIITPDLQGLWNGTFTNLPRFDATGQLFEYTIKEVAVPNYKSEINGFEITNTLQMGALKITKRGLNNQLLSGAIFELRKLDGSVAKDIQGNNLTGTTVDGILHLHNIPLGTYTLVETKAPDGYELADRTWTVTITNSTVNNPFNEMTIDNKPLQPLPSTGGPGTFLFTLLGIGTMLSAGFLFIQTNSNRKGRKTMSRITKFITAIFMAMMVMMGALQPLIASAAIARPETGDLIIHKRQFNGEEIPAIENHNGLEMTQPPGTAGLAGVTFNIYKVGDLATSTEIPTGATIADTGTTVTNGYLKFENLDAGRYLVVEDITNLPFGVTYTSPNFLVDVPMTNPGGTGWLSEVHVYPKNRLVLATIDLYKFFENKEDNPDKTATFQLWKAGTTPVLMETETVSTNGDGRILFNNNGLGYPVGDYYAIETSVDEPYGRNMDRLDITVTTTHHDTNLTDETATVHFNNSNTAFTNFLLTDPNKINTEEDNPDYSASIGETVTWNITVKLPANIDEYTLYSFTDTLDSKLDYKGNVTTKVDGTAIPSTITPPATGAERGGTFTVDFDIDDLAAHGGKTLVISFDTVINETALMGEKIPNNFVLSFNNGSGIKTKVDPTPPYTQTGGAHFDKISTSATITNFAGAQFWVYRMIGTEKQYLQANNSWSATNATPRVLTSAADGTFKIDGLAFGTYFLEERVALPGHMLPGRDFEFEVNASTHNTELPTNIIENRPRITLPSTGGIGTVLFTIAGAGLMAGAVKLYKKEEKE